MRVRDPSVVRVRRVVQLAARRVALDERAVRHPRVVQHEVHPHVPYERERHDRAIRREVRLELEAGGVQGHRVDFGGGRAVRAPASLQRLRDPGDLRCIRDEPRLDRPRVSVLRRERCRLVVSEETGAGLPETGDRGRLDDGCEPGPPFGRCGIVLDSGDGDAEVEGVEEDGVGLDVVAAHAEPEPVVRGGNVRKARAVYLSHRPLHPSFPLSPLPVEVGLITAPVVEIPDADEGVEVVGEGNTTEKVDRVPPRGKRSIGVLEVEDGVEGVLDGDEVERRNGDSGD